MVSTVNFHLGGHPVPGQKEKAEKEEAEKKEGEVGDFWVDAVFACCFWLLFFVIELKGFFLVVLDGKLLLQ